MVLMMVLNFWIIITLYENAVSKNVGRLDERLLTRVAEIGCDNELAMENRFIKYTIIKILNTGGKLFVNALA